MWPNYHSYRADPNALTADRVTVVVEYGFYSIPNPANTAMETHRSGRTLILIEGEDELVAPYLDSLPSMEDVKKGGDN